MTATRGKIQYDVTAKTAQFTSAMKQVDGRLKQMQTGLKAIAGLTAGAFATGRIFAFAQESIRLFEIQEKAEIKLRKALGGNIKAFDQLTEQASKLQRITLFGDEQTIEAQAQLAVLIDNVDAIKRLTPLVQDLATVMNMDLKAAAALVAKSVGSSTNALSRYGITVEGAVGSSERLESAIRSLQQVAGGQAAAVGIESMTSNVNDLRMAWGDLQETIGEGILKVVFADPVMQSFKMERERLAEFARVMAGPVGPNLPQTTVGLWVTEVENLNNALDDLQRRVSSPDLKEIFLKDRGIQGIKGLHGIEGTVTGGISPSMEKRIGAFSENIRQIIPGYKDIEQVTVDIGEATDQWRNSMYGVQTVARSVEKILAAAGVRVKFISEILSFLQTSFNLFSLVSGLGAIPKGPNIPLAPVGPNVQTGLKGFGPLPGLGGTTVMRGQDLVGVVNANRAIGTSLGVVSGN